MATHKRPPKKEPLVIRTHSLTKETDRFLQRIHQEASDVLGWTVSSSAVVRALLQIASQQPASWNTTVLFPVIDREISEGFVWGSKKK